MITQRQTQSIMFKLRCAAERDPNDVIANSCSQLAFELETPSRVDSLTEMDRQLIAYAFKKDYVPLKEKIRG
jgi:hypothetical protein